MNLPNILAVLMFFTLGVAVFVNKRQKDKLRACEDALKMSLDSDLYCTVNALETDKRAIVSIYSPSPDQKNLWGERLIFPYNHENLPDLTMEVLQWRVCFKHVPEPRPVMDPRNPTSYLEIVALYNPRTWAA